jgi:hypothetical protein
MMATLRQFPAVGFRFLSPPEHLRIGQRGALGRALRIARELVLVLWLITALAFWLVVIAGCVL